MKCVSIYPCPCDPVFRHEANIAICNDDKVFAYEEAKLNQIKDFANCLFPDRALSYGLKELNLEPSEIDYWIFPAPSNFFSKDALLTFLHMIKAIPQDGVAANGSNIHESEIISRWYDEHVRFVPHSMMHAGLAAYTAPNSPEYVLVMDGGGDEGDPTDLLFGKVSAGGIEELIATRNRQNLGKFHTLITDQLGFSFNSNGKVSGLSGYGHVKPELYDLFVSRESWIDGHSLKFDRGIKSRGSPDFSKASNDSFSFIKYINPPPGPCSVSGQLYGYTVEDVAATAEEYLASRVIATFDRLLTRFGISSPIKLGVAGGIFNNVRLNRVLCEHPMVLALHTTMAPGDSGLALGGMLCVVNKMGGNIAVSDPFLGPSFTDEEILDVLTKHNLIFEKKENIAIDVAVLLNSDNVIGWFQGRGEYGPRSLGGRSILAHPNSRLSKEKVNHLAKRRDWFMPFAPAVLSECLKDFSSSPERVSAYMQVATEVTDDARSKIRSGVHVDGTARIQAVHSSTNRRFYEMILKFKELTGIGAVLNTSFNRHGIATISTPRHAVEHLLEGCVDYLAIGNFLVARNKNRMDAMDLVGSLCPENPIESLAEMNKKFRKIHESK